MQPAAMSAALRSSASAGAPALLRAPMHLRDARSCEFTHSHSCIPCYQGMQAQQHCRDQCGSRRLRKNTHGGHSDDSCRAPCAAGISQGPQAHASSGIKPLHAYVHCTCRGHAYSRRGLALCTHPSCANLIYCGISCQGVRCQQQRTRRPVRAAGGPTHSQCWGCEEALLAPLPHDPPGQVLPPACSCGI